jgi:hypothetical protein
MIDLCTSNIKNQQDATSTDTITPASLQRQPLFPNPNARRFIRLTLGGIYGESVNGAEDLILGGFGCHDVLTDITC